MRALDKSRNGQSEIQKDHFDSLSAGYLAVMVLACIVILIAGNGCSAVGHKLGTMIDETGGNCNPRDAARLAPGTTKFFHLRDGTRLVGTYIGQDTISTRAYNETFARATANRKSGARLPCPGETITVAINDAKTAPYEFSYFDYHDDRSPSSNTTVSLAQKYFIAMKASSEDSLTQTDFQTIEFIQLENGKKTEGHDLLAMALNGGIPLKSALAVSTSNASMTIPLHDIDEIETPRKHYARWVGFSLGLTVDIAMVAGAILAIWDPVELHWGVLTQVVGDSEIRKCSRDRVLVLTR